MISSLLVAMSCAPGTVTEQDGANNSLANKQPRAETTTVGRSGAEGTTRGKLPTGIMRGEELVAQGRYGIAVIEGGVVFVRVKPDEGPDAVMDAAWGGKLYVDEASCLRLEAARGYASDYLPVWPAGYSLDREGRRLRVLDEKGQVVGEVGQEFRLGGGEIKQDEAGRRNFAEKRRELGIPDRCPGPLWMAAPYE